MAAEPVMIQVSANQRQGRIEPMLYGQFIEHLGSCINGGIFDPGSPLADESGFRRDVMAKVRELNPPMLRWPGGTFTKIYHLDQTYTWQDALAVASWLNAMQRHSEIIGFATWAQMVNVIAPIQADKNGSIRQTVFHPLALFAKHSRNWNVPVRCDSPLLADRKLPALDVVASVADQDGSLAVFIVNRHPSQAIVRFLKLSQRPSRHASTIWLGLIHSSSSQRRSNS